jgi:DNA repair photolyase
LRGPEAFERQIFIKQNAAWLLEQELKKIDPAEEIAVGTATDPYQPIERRARVTRSILEVFARRRGYRIGIVTKSKLIVRDIDLLLEIAKRNALVVHMTITTTDAELARVLEPRAPRPDLRFAAVRALRVAGVTAGVFGSPVLPGITDTASALDQLARQAADVGASFFAAHPLYRISSRTSGDGQRGVPAVWAAATLNRCSANARWAHRERTSYGHTGRGTAEVIRLNQ